jgi:hypothetical protein
MHKIQLTNYNENKNFSLLALKEKSNNKFSALLHPC